MIFGQRFCTSYQPMSNRSMTTVLPASIRGVHGSEQRPKTICVTSKVTQVNKLFKEQFTKMVFESRVFTLIIQKKDFIDLTVRINEKFISEPREVIQNWKKGGESLNKIAHYIKEHTRMLKNSGIV